MDLNPGAGFIKGLSLDLKFRLLFLNQAKSVVLDGFTKGPKFWQNLSANGFNFVNDDLNMAVVYYSHFRISNV